MISVAKPSSCLAAANFQEQFTSMLPSIILQARWAFRGLRRQAREDLIQEVVANAYCAFAQLISLNKADVAYSTPLAEYAIRQTRAGRRVGCRLNARDVSSPYAHRVQGIVLERLDRFDQRDGRWQEAVVEDRRAGPADTAAARIDLAAWFRSLPPCQRRIAKLLAMGETTSGAAQKLKLSSGRISQLRREFEASWKQLQCAS